MTQTLTHRFTKALNLLGYNVDVVHDLTCRSLKGSLEDCKYLTMLKKADLSVKRLFVCEDTFVKLLTPTYSEV